MHVAEGAFENDLEALTKHFSLRMTNMIEPQALAWSILRHLRQSERLANCADYVELNAELRCPWVVTMRAFWDY